MECRDDDRRLFGEEITLAEAIQSPQRLTLAAIIGGLILALSFVSYIDVQSAPVVAEAHAVASEKKQAVMGHPCTYVAQCYRFERDCDVRQRACVDADLTGKQ